MAGKQWRLFLTLLLLCTALFIILYFDGGLKPADRAIASGVIAMATLVLFSGKANWSGQGSWQTLRHEISRSIGVPCCMLAGFAILQLIPLPLSILQIVSPARAALAQAVMRVNPGAGWAPISVAPARSLLEWLTVLDCVLVCLCVHRLAVRARSKWWIITPILLGGLLEAFDGLLQASNPNGPATATGTFLNRNHLAGFLELLLPFPLAGSWFTWNQRHLRPLLSVCATALLFCSALLFVGGVFYTYSRSGLVVVLFVVAITLGMTLWPQSRASPRNFWIGFTLLALLLATGFLAAPSRLVNRFQHASTIDRDSTQIRLAIWKDSLPLLADYAFTGTGLGTFESAFPRYQRGGTAYRIEYAHNDYLQAAVELGLLPFSLCLFLLGFILYRCYSSIGSSAEIRNRCLAIACFASLCGILLHSFVDFNLRIPANAITCAWVVGVGFSIAAEPEGRATSKEREANG